MPDEDRPEEPGSRFALARIRAKLRILQSEVQAQKQTQQALIKQIEDLKAAVEAQRLNQQSIEERLAEQHSHIQENRALLNAILNSRIWRALAGAGGLALRLRLGLRPVKGRGSSPEAAGDEDAAAGNAAETQSSKPRTIEQLKERIALAAVPLRKDAPAKPAISIVTPMFNTRSEWLADAAVSLFQQTCSSWEWCLVDDGSTDRGFEQLFPELERSSRVKFCRMQSRGGISAALNAGLRVATGEFVGFLDHDDVLEPGALAQCLAILAGPFDAVYTDEDKISESGLCHTPLPKPDWSPEFFRWVMFIGHLLCVRRDLAIEIGGFDSRYDRIQDYEFMLRYSERTSRIAHVSRILYHWRSAEGSIASDQQAKGDLAELQIAAVQAQLERLHLAADAAPGPRNHMLKLVPRRRLDQPKVSIVLVAEKGPDTLANSIVSLFAETTYDNFEIICVDDGTQAAGDLIRDFPLVRISYRGRWSVSEAIHLGVRNAAGKFVALIGEGLTALSPNWIEEMLYYAEQRDVGCVGGLFLHPDRTVKHAGIMGISCDPDGHLWRYALGEPDGYWGSADCAHEVTAVSAACMMAGKQVFEEAGGFDPSFRTASRDVDFCLRLLAMEKRNIFTPRAAFIDCGVQASEQRDDAADRTLLVDRWPSFFSGCDPYYKRAAAASIASAAGK